MHGWMDRQTDRSTHTHILFSVAKPQAEAEVLTVLISILQRLILLQKMALATSESKSYAIPWILDEIHPHPLIGTVLKSPGIS